MNDDRHLNVMVVRGVIDSQMRLIVPKERFFFVVVSVKRVGGKSQDSISSPSNDGGSKLSTSS